jgi:hypothetical protein
MQVPFQRANLLLTLMSGPKIDKWAALRGEELTLRVFGDPNNNVAPTHLETDEDLWNDLCLALKAAYSEYHGVEGAFRQISSLKQLPGKVDDYIATFENLLGKTEWRRDDFGTIETFKEGLILPLLKDCLKRRPPPRTLTDWEDAARDEEQAYYALEYALGLAKRRRGRLGDLLMDASAGKQKGRKPASDRDPRPYDPMQVDAARTQRLTQAEREKLQKEGKCFNCKKTGHMYRECPTKPKSKGKGKARPSTTYQKPRARAAEASGSIKEAASDAESEGSQTAPPAYTTKDLKAAIKSMTTEDKEKFLDDMALDSDQDF